MAVDNVDEGSNSNLSSSSDREPADTSPPPRAVRALSQTQERNLMGYLEARFLDVTRNFKKRCALSWTLPPLSLPFLSQAPPRPRPILDLAPLPRALPPLLALLSVRPLLALLLLRIKRNARRRRLRLFSLLL